MNSNTLLLQKELVDIECTTVLKKIIFGIKPLNNNTFFAYPNFDRL